MSDVKSPLKSKTYAIRSMDGKLLSLVSAKTEAGAVAYYARRHITASIASFDDGVQAATNGIAIECAIAEPAAQASDASE